MQVMKVSKKRQVTTIPKKVTTIPKKVTTIPKKVTTIPKAKNHDDRLLNEQKGR